MEQVYRDFNSPHWWISVVLVSLLVGLVTSRIDALLSKSTARVLSFWRKRSAAQAAREQEQIASLRASEYAQVMAAVDAVHLMARGVGLFVMSGWLFTMLSQPPMKMLFASSTTFKVVHVISVLCAIVAMMLGMTSITGATELRRVIRAAKGDSK
ncbi:hypothetical protein ACLEPN_29670 [Myxococcus sp. 1LA]